MKITDTNYDKYLERTSDYYNLITSIMDVLKMENGSKILADILKDELKEEQKIKLTSFDLARIFIKTTSKATLKKTGIFKQRKVVRGEIFQNLELACFFNISDIKYQKLFPEQIAYFKDFEIPLRPRNMLSTQNLNLNGITIEGDFTDCNISGTSFKGAKGAKIDLSTVTYDSRTDFTDAEVKQFIKLKDGVKKHVKNKVNSKETLSSLVCKFPKY